MLDILLIVPAFETLEAWADGQGLTYANREELVMHPVVLDHYDKVVEDRTQSLGRVEKIKKIRLLPRELSQEAGELTPTVKIKRKVVADHFMGLIDQMYGE